MPMAGSTPNPSAAPAPMSTNRTLRNSGARCTSGSRQRPRPPRPLPEILRLETDLPAFERSRQQYTAGVGCGSEDPRIAFGEAELVTDVRAAHRELPVVAHGCGDSEVPQLIGPELLET